MCEKCDERKIQEALNRVKQIMARDPEEQARVKRFRSDIRANYFKLLKGEQEGTDPVLAMIKAGIPEDEAKNIHEDNIKWAVTLEDLVAGKVLDAESRETITDKLIDAHMAYITVGPDQFVGAMRDGMRSAGLYGQEQIEYEAKKHGLTGTDAEKEEILYESALKSMKEDPRLIPMAKVSLLIEKDQNSVYAKATRRALITLGEKVEEINLPTPTPKPIKRPIGFNPLDPFDEKLTKH
jgi:hypothetical protein